MHAAHRLQRQESRLLSRCAIRRAALTAAGVLPRPWPRRHSTPAWPSESEMICLISSWRKLTPQLFVLPSIAAQICLILLAIQAYSKLPNPGAASLFACRECRAPGQVSPRGQTGGQPAGFVAHQGSSLSISCLVRSLKNEQCMGRNNNCVCLPPPIVKCALTISRGSFTPPTLRFTRSNRWAWLFREVPRRRPR